MPEQKKFNLLRFVYGELFLQAQNKTVAMLTVEAWKLKSWTYILKWLNKNQHITTLNIERVSPSLRRISYIFNEENLIYPQYINYLKRLSD